MHVRESAPCSIMVSEILNHLFFTFLRTYCGTAIVRNFDPYVLQFAVFGKIRLIWSTEILNPLSYVFKEILENCNHTTARNSDICR